MNVLVRVDMHAIIIVITCVIVHVQVVGVHVVTRVSATTAPMSAVVVVMVHVIIHVSHLLKVKIQQHLRGKIKNLKIG